MQGMCMYSPKYESVLGKTNCGYIMLFFVLADFAQKNWA